MIKIRAGQIWEFKSGALNYNKGDRLRIWDLYNEGYYDAKPINIVDPSDSYSVSSKFLNECFNFIPQNDLEFLAVNTRVWTHGCAEMHGIKRQQWQNMRYYLGKDKKPHYEFINGQWSETK
jgi:hypothetical protein